MRRTIVRCDGCGAESEARKNAIPPGWARVHVFFTDAAGIDRKGARDVCADPMCVARAVEVLRDVESPLRLVR